MNKDKIIKDLKERNDKLANQRRQFELNYYHEQHIVEELDKEIERLNNIIDEIFVWMQNKYDNSELTGFTVSFQELQDLKELKESK